MQLFIIILVAIAAVAIVIYPIMSARGDEGRGGGFAGAEGGDVDAAVARYREAVRAGTLCLECGFANLADAHFCADCGEPLIAAEFGAAAADEAGPAPVAP